MLSKGKKLVPKASHLGLHIIDILYIFTKALWFFVLLLYISTASLSFLYIYNFLHIYSYIHYSVF